MPCVHTAGSGSEITSYFTIHRKKFRQIRRVNFVKNLLFSSLSEVCVFFLDPNEVAFSLLWLNRNLKLI